MRVTACIVGFRNVEDIRQCVAALGRSSHASLDVVICENGGGDFAARLIGQVPPTLPNGGTVRVVDAGGNLGYAGGFNCCLDAAPDADAWWLVNPDAEPEPEALALMLARLARGDCNAVGATLLLGDGRVQAFGGRFNSWMARAVSIGHGAPGSTEPDPAGVEARMNYLLGASMLVDRIFVERAGRMRDDYFLYAEEIEWCLRALARGLRLGFAPGARVLHRQGTTTGSDRSPGRRPWLPVYLDERNRLNVVRDTVPGRIPAAALGALAIIAWRYVRRGAWRQTGYALSGWAAGLRNERGVPAKLLRETAGQ